MSSKGLGVPCCERGKLVLGPFLKWSVLEVLGFFCGCPKKRGGRLIIATPKGPKP